MKYITVQEASKLWGISDRRIRFLCSQGRIRGIIQQGRRYLIPDGTEKPVDERIKKSKVSKSLHYNDFTRLDLLKGMIEKQPELSKQADKLYEDAFLEEFVYDCNRLEGTSLSKEEMKQVLDGNVVAGHSLSEHMHVKGTVDAWNYILECVSDRKPLSQNMIRTIHSLTMIDDPDHKGKYRKVKVRLQGADSNPVYLDLMEPRINDLLNINTQRKKVMHPIERIARFHLEFEGIHPFALGNGRVGRLLMNLELMQNGYPPINIQYDQKDAYEQAIQSYYADHQPDAMVRLISEYLEESLENTLTENKRKSKKQIQTDSSNQKKQKTEPAAQVPAAAF